MTKSEIVEKLVDVYANPDIPVTAAGGVFTFTYGDEVVGKYTPTELMKAAHESNPNIKERYAAELNGSFLMFKFFKKHPELFLPGKSLSLAKKMDLNEPLQKIVYGAPGTGKSHGTNDKIAEAKIPADCVFRTTFHPDSDYSTFVGAYKPTMDKTDKKIVYDFRPQAFINAYVKAWEQMANPAADGSVTPVVLVIEEINRGNCAQIFGDLFQLLDRDDDGYSKYPITPDADLAGWLEGKVPDATTLKLPPNLYIWATMNTSDQSLFPIDSAFKRRWDWQYTPITDAGKGYQIKIKIKNGEVEEEKTYDWWKFLEKVNKVILDTTKSEDKQMGYFFVQVKDGEGISSATFVNKVLFYLFGDVFKDWDLPVSLFKKDGSNDKYAFKDFFGAQGKVNDDAVVSFLDNLKLT